MVVSTQEAPSVIERGITRDDVLRRIPGAYIDNMVLRPYLDREVVIGTIGQRGGGKSATCAVLGIIHFMFMGKPVWSNMKVKLDLEIPDEIARKHGLNYGGVVHYESLPLEKEALLKLDDTYRDGCLVIEEINVQYSNVRRFMTNTNLNFNEVCQQLRKFKTSLYYNVIDEMFVDSQLRGLTDIMISTYDTAFDLDSLSKHKQSGLDFHWSIYPLTGYLCGEQGRYAFTKKPLVAYFHFEPWRGVYDSMKHQEKGKYSQTTKEINASQKAQLSISSSEDIQDHMNQWDWLYKEITQRYRAGVVEVERYRLFDELGIEPSEEQEVDKILVGEMRLRVRWSGGLKFYTFPDKLLKLKRESALAATT